MTAALVGPTVFLLCIIVNNIVAVFQRTPTFSLMVGHIFLKTSSTKLYDDAMVLYMSSLLASTKSVDRHHLSKLIITLSLRFAYLKQNNI